MGGAVVFLSSPPSDYVHGVDAAGRRRLALALARGQLDLLLRDRPRGRGDRAVLDNVEQRGGLGGVTVAAAYHEGRDVFPHNPVRKVRFLESGAVFFQPGRRCARAAAAAGERGGARAAGAVAAAGRRGLAVRAWTVFLHNGALAAAHPSAPRERLRRPLRDRPLPRHPDCRAYARALAADIARSASRHLLGVAPLPRLEHGYAHERYFVPLGPRVRYLLGLCFCEHCLAAARAPASTASARRGAREEIERAFAGDDPAASRSATSTRRCASRS
jgi:hypothetical protein